MSAWLESFRCHAWNLLNTLLARHNMYLLLHSERTEIMSRQRYRVVNIERRRDAPRWNTHPPHKLHLLEEPINWQSANSVAVKMKEPR